MASFLQNNGDIILDAVLTDYGRKLLAKGDGSFNIVKFAFADDEIDYGLFDPEAPTVTQDLEIMRTPILEAFTNNAASMKNHLLTIGIENILFMPVIKINNINDGATGTFQGNSIVTYTGHVVPVDVSNTQNVSLTSQCLTGSKKNEYMQGVLNVGSRHIIVDQGLDSVKLNSNQNLKDTSPMLYETEFNVYVDNRFCSVGKNNTGALMSMSPMSVDDDNIAVYKFTEQTLVDNTSMVAQIKTSTTKNDSVIAGTKGSRLSFTIIPNANLLYTNNMFDKYGKVLKLNPAQPSKEFRTIRMPVRIVGVTTGYSLEVPVLFAKVI